MTDIIVVGGGAAGMMAALTAAQGGTSVALLERNPKLGRKLYITGKGRCNVTNHCSVQEVLDSTPRNSRFLYGAMTRTPPAWVEDFFRQEGVPLKVERGKPGVPGVRPGGRHHRRPVPCPPPQPGAGHTGPGPAHPCGGWRGVRRCRGAGKVSL